MILDGIAFSLQQHGGISVYVRQLLARLARDRFATTLTLHEALRQAARTFDSLRLHHRPSRWLERYRRCELPDAPAVFHSS